MGCCRAVSTKKAVFAQKWQKNATSWPKTVFFFAGVLSCRAPYPILRVSDQLKRGLNRIAARSGVFQSLQHQKTSLFAQK